MTLHLVLALPVGNKTLLSAFKKIALEERFSRNTNRAGTYIFVDERSLVGSNMFYWMDQRAQTATGFPDDFGGFSIIMVGDLTQLPPVADSVIYPPRKLDPKRPNLRHAFRLHQLFTDVVIFTENKRVKGKKLKRTRRQQINTYY